MFGDVVEPVGVALDREVKPPPSRDPGLPEVARLVVLLGAQGGVAEVLEQELEFLVKGPLDGGWSAGVAADEALREGSGPLPWPR